MQNFIFDKNKLSGEIPEDFIIHFDQLTFAWFE